MNIKVESAQIQGEADSYGLSFENERRLHPKIWHPDFCLLRGLRVEVSRFIREHAVSEDLTVVDYGCGAKPYRSLFPPSCNYLGIDVCQNPWADFVIEPKGAVPLADNVADLLISIQVVYLVKEYEFYLQECHRLLKNSGLLFLTSHGTWTYHPASGGDYYRFTQDGIKHILDSAGFEVCALRPIVGTLGTGLHLRQLVFNSWLKRFRLSALAGVVNVITNLRIMLEDRITPRGTNMASPVIFACVARPKLKS